MVVEGTDAAVAGATVLAGRPTVAVAELAVEDFIVLGGKGDLLVVARPLVVVYDPVCGVSAGGDGRGDD